MARSSSGSVAIHYVLPVLQMTSRLTVVGRVSMHGLSVAKYSAPRGVARPGRSMMFMNELFIIYDLLVSSLLLSLLIVVWVTQWCNGQSIGLAIQGSQVHTTTLCRGYAVVTRDIKLL